MQFLYLQFVEFYRVHTYFAHVWSDGRKRRDTERRQLDVAKELLTTNPHYSKNQQQQHGKPKTPSPLIACASIHKIPCTGTRLRMHVQPMRQNRRGNIDAEEANGKRATRTWSRADIRKERLLKWS